MPPFVNSRTSVYYEREEMLYLTTHSANFIYNLWRRTYKGPLRQRERKPAAASTWTTLYE